jgi:hypothetical protein
MSVVFSPPAEASEHNPVPAGESPALDRIPLDQMEAEHCSCLNFNSSALSLALICCRTASVQIAA